MSYNVCKGKGKVKVKVNDHNIFFPHKNYLLSLKRSKFNNSNILYKKWGVPLPEGGYVLMSVSLSVLYVFFFSNFQQFVWKILVGSWPNFDPIKFWSRNLDLDSGILRRVRYNTVKMVLKWLAIGEQIIHNITFLLNMQLWWDWLSSNS